MSVRYGQRAASAIAVEAGTDLRSVLSIVFGIPRLQPWGGCQPDLTGLAEDASHRLEIVDQTGPRGVAGCVSCGRKSGSRSRGSAQAVLCPRVSAGGRTASRIRFGNPLPVFLTQ